MASTTTWPVDHDRADRRPSEPAGYAQWLLEIDSQDKANAKENEAGRVERQASVEAWERGSDMPALHGSDTEVGSGSRLRDHMVAAHGHVLGIGVSDRFEPVKHAAGRIISDSWWIDQPDANPEDVAELVADAQTGTENPNSPVAWGDAGPAVVGREDWDPFDLDIGPVRIGRLDDRNRRRDTGMDVERTRGEDTDIEPKAVDCAPTQIRHDSGAELVWCGEIGR